MAKLGDSTLCSFYIVLSLWAGYWDRNEVFRLLRRFFDLECFLGPFVFSH